MGPRICHRFVTAGKRGGAVVCSVCGAPITVGDCRPLLLRISDPLVVRVQSSPLYTPGPFFLA